MKRLLPLVGLLACTVPVPFAERWFFTTDRAQLPEAHDCERCHGEIYREWADSGHADAWRSEDFVAITADRAATECLACHAPAPLGSNGQVHLREDNRAEGVSCVSCHLSPDPDAEPLTMRGPHRRTTAVKAHPVVTDPLFRSAELCGTCHEGVLAQWKRAPEPYDGDEKEVCQDCHMPAVRRTMESYDSARPYSAVLVALGDPVDGRRHRFEVPPDPWEDIGVSAAPVPGGLRVRVQNRLPHAIPTGSFGRREARLRVTWPGGEQERRLRADLGEAIPAGSTFAFVFEGVPGDATVVLERLSPRTGKFERLAPEGGEKP